MLDDQPKAILIRNAEVGETFSLAFQHSVKVKAVRCRNVPNGAV